MRKLLIFLPMLVLMALMPIYVRRVPERLMWNTGTETEGFRWSFDTLPVFLNNRRFIASEDMPFLWLIGNVLLWIICAALLTTILSKVWARLFARSRSNR